MVGAGAGALSAEVEERLRGTLPDHLVVRLDAEGDVRAQIGDATRVVVAGGDGTAGMVLRALAGEGRVIGILPLGTYNNFARSLGIPEDLDEALALLRTGRPRPVTLGAIAERPFLEVAAAGVFGELMLIGEAAKHLAFGELGERLRHLPELTPFRYRLGGDVRGRGRASSLVFSNTPTTGAHVPVGDATPHDPDLELALGMATRGGVLARIAAAVLSRPGRGPSTLNLRFRRLTVHTEPAVPVFADNHEVGRTPVTVEARPRALTIIQP